MDGVNEGEWAVFAAKVAEERDKAIEEIQKVKNELRVAEASHDVALKERDLARMQQARVEWLLCHLLARVHRDGGQYTERVEMDASVARADEIVARLYVDASALWVECAELRTRASRTEKLLSDAVEIVQDMAPDCDEFLAEAVSHLAQKTDAAIRAIDAFAEVVDVPRPAEQDASDASGGMNWTAARASRALPWWEKKGSRR